MLPTSPEYFHTYFGVLLAGGIPVPIYPPASLSQIEEHVRRHASILSNAEASILVTVPEARGVARLLEARVTVLHRVVTVAELVAEPPAPVAVAAGAAPAAAAAAEPVEEKTEFDVVLKGPGPKKIEVIKVIRQLTNLGLVEAKTMAETAGAKVLTAVSKQAAADAKVKLETAGGEVEVA